MALCLRKRGGDRWLAEDLGTAPTCVLGPRAGEEAPPWLRQVARTPFGVDEPRPCLSSKRYTVQRLVGRGGMGAVYLAFDAVLDKQVALKVVRLRRGAGLARLRDEVVLAQEVSHRNVCRTYDVEECDGCWQIKMEFVDGQTLSQRVGAAGPLPVAEAIALCRQIAHGLHASHERGVVHRDVKPQNIMIENGTGRAVLMDFGVARGPDLAGRTAEGICGTPEFMAPEQARGREVDARADLYSLGCVLYYMLTGQVVFPARNAMQCTFRHAEDRPVSPRVARPEVPPWLAHLTLGLLEKDPARRPADAGQVIAALSGPPRGLRAAVGVKRVVALVGVMGLMGFAALLGGKAERTPERLALCAAGESSGRIQCPSATR